MISQAQYDFLVRPLDPERAAKDPRGNSYIEQWDVRRHLIRVFGFGGWDFTLRDVDLVDQRQEDNKGRPSWTVVYRATGCLNIHTGTDDWASMARYEDGAIGEAIRQPTLGDAHDQALKSAISGALKRCAVNLGDAFGLGLYSGQAGAVVGRSLVRPEAAIQKEKQE